MEHSINVLSHSSLQCQQYVYEMICIANCVMGHDNVHISSLTLSLYFIDYLKSSHTHTHKRLSLSDDCIQSVCFLCASLLSNASSNNAFHWRKICVCLCKIDGTNWIMNRIELNGIAFALITILMSNLLRDYSKYRIISLDDDGRVFDAWSAIVSVHNSQAETIPLWTHTFCSSIKIPNWWGWMFDQAWIKTDKTISITSQSIMPKSTTQHINNRDQRLSKLIKWSW